MNTARIAGFSIMKPLSSLSPYEIKILVAQGEISPQKAKELLKQIKKGEKIWEPFPPSTKCSPHLW